MSTLLKALHRAQHPLNSGYAPYASHGFTHQEGKRRSYYWVIWIPFSLMLGAGANYSWHLFNLQPIQENVEIKEVITPAFVRVEPTIMITRALPEPPPRPIVKPQTNTATAAVNQSKKSDLSLAEQLLIAFQETQDITAPATSAPLSTTPAPVALSQAPLTIRQQVPSLAYGSHVFSSNPAKRAVQLNGREYREGGVIAPNVTLTAIEKEHITLQVGASTVSLQALQDWSSP